MFGRLFEGWHIVVLIVVVVLIFGWKRLPDAARSLGRSARILKSEMAEMKNDEHPTSAASSDTVRGETVNPVQDPTQQQPATQPQPAAQPQPQAATPPQPAAPQPAAPQQPEPHQQPPA